jgi:AcrR family transcriptional regulator
MENPKTKIIQTALKLFAENGFDGTGIRKIAEEAEVNSAMISYYFGSKKGLLVAVITHYLDALLSFEKHIDSSLNPDEKIKTAVEFLVFNIIEHYQVGMLIVREKNILRGSGIIKLLSERDDKFYGFLLKNFSELNPEVDKLDVGMLYLTLKAVLMHIGHNLPLLSEMLGVDELNLEIPEIRNKAKEVIAHRMKIQIDRLIKGV